MTSTVKVTAHCAATKHVEVRVFEESNVPMVEDKRIEEFFLNNEETKEVYIYDNRYVVTRELEK
jgi:hypothetical protein